MNRLFIALAASIIGMTSCCNCAKQEAVPEFGIQLYSVRTLVGDADLYAANHVQVLSELASYGYTSVEAANYWDGLFYGVTPEQFSADCEAAGLKAISSHTMRGLSPEEMAARDFSGAMVWWDQCITAHKAAVIKYIVCPSFHIPDNLEELGFYCQYFNAIGAKCKEAGLKFGIHNHTQEFNSIDGVKIYDYLIANTDPELVFLQMDVYWATRANESPVEYFKANPGLFKVLHIKDKAELGESGMVGFDAIYRNVAAAGTECYIVEIEKTSVDDIMLSCKMSADYLKNLKY